MKDKKEPQEVRVLRALSYGRARGTAEFFKLYPPILRPASVIEKLVNEKGYNIKNLSRPGKMAYYIWDKDCPMRRVRDMELVPEEKSELEMADELDKTIGANNEEESQEENQPQKVGEEENCQKEEASCYGKAGNQTSLF